jgi:hypothetical protein
MKSPKNELEAHSNTWWTFLKMADQMKNTFFHSPSFQVELMN